MKLDLRAAARASFNRTLVETVLGLLLIGIGTFLTSMLDNRDTTVANYVRSLLPIVLGVGILIYGFSGGYRSFVAWRYLLVAQSKVTRTTKLAILGTVVVRALWWGLSGHGVGATMLAFMVPFDTAENLVTIVTTAAIGIAVFWGVLRHSRPAMWVFLFGVAIGVICNIVIRLMAKMSMPMISGFSPELQVQIEQGLGIAMLVGFVLAGLATFFGSLRAFFTFFTTVPIGGVWIGTAALVCVLAVMSGFETDLRDKILGSNAHIQITREDGEFVNWREVKARIDKIPGVVASTPYAVSEVVIAAHNNGMNVIIKGIDPATVASVTDLVSDLEDKDAMKRLEPLVSDDKDLTVPQTQRPATDVDPAPDDLPSASDPIDFSTPHDADDDKEDAWDRAPSGKRTKTDDDFGGDARGIQRDLPRGPAMDPPPPDLVTTDTPPEDFSGGSVARGGEIEPPISVIDIPEPSLSRRTQSLPGVIVGRELVKQTHLYTGEEVRVVSPLSDPSNPDATGTPIPFNRDYRVAGIFFTGMYEYDLKYVYVTLESLQDFLDRGDAIDGIEVRIHDADDTERYIPTALSGPGLLGKELGPGYRIVDWRELNRSLFSALKLEKIAMFLVLGIVILVASFSIVGNLIMVVVEKQREIALLKTLGASNRGVMELFALQGLMIGLIGTVLGVATGLLGCWAGKRFGLPLNPDVYYIDKLPIHVDPQSVIAAAAAGILISMAATLYPALLAARVRPAAGMRH